MEMIQANERIQISRFVVLLARPKFSFERDTQMTVKKLVKRDLHPVVERASYIAARLKEGATYQQAVREADNRKHQ